MTYMFVAVSVISVLHLWPVAASAFPYDHVCTVEQDFNSPFVYPFFEKTAFVSGCESRENTSDAREVHVISLVGGGPGEVTMEDDDDEDGDRPEVMLHIKPRGSGIHAVPMIFILVSHSRVAWKIESDRISNQTRHMFILSDKSRLFRDEVMRIKVKKFKIPVEKQELAQWVRKGYDAITSFTEVQAANTFYKTVGIDPTKPSMCDVNNDEYMPLRRGSITAYHLQPQPVSGCVLPENFNRMNSDVHIIELHSANIVSDSQAVDTVVLDIRTRKRVQHKNLILILKSHNTIEWRVRTKHLRGQLEIITNNLVNTVGVLMQSTMVAAEPLSDSGQDLINWVMEKYGSFISYSDIQNANKIDLIVDGADSQAVVSKEPPQDDEPNRGGRRKSPFDDPQRTQRALSQAIKREAVTCHRNGMIVTLKKSTLQMYGIRREHLSLADESCTAISNTTHIHLETALSSCQTAQRENNDRVVFTNAIIVHNIEEAELGEDDDGSAYWNDEDIIASGFFLDDTHIDDEDYEPTSHNGIVVQFRCEYSSDAFNNPREQPQAFYQLELYKDEAYTHRFRSFPIEMDVPSSLYVEARVEGNEKLRAVIQNCWVTSSQTDENERQNLLVRGCAVGESEHIPGHAVQGRTSSQGSPWTQSQRFKFVFHQYYDPDTVAYLQCELTMCSRDGTYGAPTVKRCVSVEEYCMRNQVQGNKQKRLPHSKTMTLGPLVALLDPDDLRIHQQNPTNLQTGDDRKCEQVVHVEGLDSGTVVGIAFASFIIGVLLTAALWFIHTHTNGRKTARQRSNETSGESTPSSTAPITIHQIHT